MKSFTSGERFELGVTSSWISSRPEAVNFFAISRVGGDVQIVTAYVDVNHAATVRLKAEKGEEVSHTLKALPMHRIAVSAGTFVQLKRRVDEIYEALLKEKRITGGEHPEHEEEE